MLHKKFCKRTKKNGVYGFDGKIYIYIYIYLKKLL